ncbi:tetratricopeptide repeat protein, partial [Psychrobacter sp. SZ93C1]|uniref:tetratricopeptide repeat protein n=1 Tax=Psychrobacter sp. SZ93C1 TaxID=2792058 RepID=UPI0018CDD2F3
MQSLKKLCVCLLISCGLSLGTTVSAIAADFATTKALAISGDAFSQNQLAGMYSNGEIVSQNQEKAFEWVGKAANQGYVKAQFNIGVMYEYAEGTQQDYAKAIEW